MTDSTSTSEGQTPKRTGSLSRRIVIGLTAGIACGIIFGDLCSGLKILGDAFIALMQMTVLPYIVLALIVNIGSLTLATARRLALRAAVVLSGLWAVAIAVILVLPAGLPEWKTGGFFSSALLDPTETVDFVSVYVPANPFRSLADNIVPAVVVFCICLGAALIGVPNKERLIDPMRVLLDAITKVTLWVAQLIPYGIFAIAASAAGTVTVDQIGRLQGYVIIYSAAGLLLSFVVLPMGVAALTPFTYREVLAASRGPMLTAFAANNFFIVLPMLIDNLKGLFKDHGIAGNQVERTIEVTLPIGFPFPNLGRLLALAFIPFGAWFAGRPLSVMDYPVLVLAGLPSLFAKVTIAIPYLLDLMRLPADLFHLFLLTGIINGHLSSLAGAMHLFAFTAVTAAAVNGRLEFRHRHAFAAALATVGIVIACIVSTRVYLEWVLGDVIGYDAVVANMHLVTEPAAVVVLDDATPNPVPLRGGQSRVERAQSRGAIRVGFIADNLPFSFINEAGDLVGFEIDMAHELANNLGVTLELVPIAEPDAMSEDLVNDHCDLIMAGIGASVAHYLEVPFTRSYVELTPALVVPDYMRKAVDTIEELRHAKGLRIGVVNDPDIVRLAAQQLPDGDIVEISRAADYFQAEVPVADVLIISAEAGSAWTLLYPDYQVVVPFQRDIRWPLGYPVAPGDDHLLRFLNLWIDLKKDDGTIARLHDHWVLGESTGVPVNRWSVIKDVLHWVG